MSTHKIISGKSEIELKQFEDNSIDSCVTDPPYNLGFMNKAWDSAGIAFNVDLWQQVYRVLKPGAHLLAFGGTRTYHRMACAIEDAGFEIRDMIEWFYGSGFPKSLDISKAIDKKGGITRGKAGKILSNNNSMLGGNYERTDKGEPISEEAIHWDGWGTGLKPAHEPILLARKPISEGNIVDNVLKWGVGGINVDKCRHQQGRFPSNLILDKGVGNMLDGQSDNASRFFYQPKASASERWFYCKLCKRAYQIKNRDKHTHNAPTETRYKHLEFHPTQKPIQLIQYLIRLITPPNGTILDPFLGSGTALVAAEREQVNCIGIDNNQAYCNISHQRFKEETKQTNLFEEKSNITFISK